MYSTCVFLLFLICSWCCVHCQEFVSPSFSSWRRRSSVSTTDTTGHGRFLWQTKLVILCNLQCKCTKIIVCVGALIFNRQYATVYEDFLYRLLLWCFCITIIIIITDSDYYYNYIIIIIIIFCVGVDWRVSLCAYVGW